MDHRLVPARRTALGRRVQRVTFAAVLSLAGACSAPADGHATVRDQVLAGEPVAEDQAVTTLEDAPAATTLSASDPDGDVLTYEVVAGPVHGALSGAAPALVYTPDADYHGADAFTFRVFDGTSWSPEATVTIDVTPVNHGPVAVAQYLTTERDEGLALTLAGTDVDGDALTWEVTQGPVSGTLTGTPPALTYAPAAGFTGTDSFQFQVSDGQASSAPATVTLTVTGPVNDAPIAGGQAVFTAEDTALAITLAATDEEGDALTYEVATAPVHGTLGGTAPALVFTPAPDFHGLDALTFRVSDGTSWSAEATVEIGVAPVNDRPVATPLAASTEQGTPLPLTLAASDVDGDGLRYELGAPPAHGTLAGALPAVTYSPLAGFYGTDTFTFRVDDGRFYSEAATVTITVSPSSTPSGGGGCGTGTAAGPLGLLGLLRCLRGRRARPAGLPDRDRRPLP